MRAALCLVFVGLLTGCFSDSGTSPGPGEDPVLSDGNWTPSLETLPDDWPARQWPAENPYTPAKAILGRRLFFEKALSRDGRISCSWCHSPKAAFSDNHHAPFSDGIDDFPTRRNTPTLANLVFATSFMHAGEAATLEAQALHPLFSKTEMDADSAVMLARLAADTLYARLFRQAYGAGPMTFQGVVKALATYQRTLISARSPYDRWRAGDGNALSAGAKRGAEIFMGEKGACWRCHAPPLFTDGKFHNVGLNPVDADSGRAAVTGDPADGGRFKTPTLRNIERTSPYMHDGSLSTLESVVRHFDKGGAAGADSSLRPLGLNESDVSDLIEFMHSLTDESFFTDIGPQ